LHPNDQSPASNAQVMLEKRFPACGQVGEILGNFINCEVEGKEETMQYFFACKQQTLIEQFPS
jgi:hypothetical protein